MRTSRLLGAVAAASIAAIAPLSATIASAQETNGVGTGRVGSTLLQIDVGGGDVLSVRVLSDNGSATIDPVAGPPSSSTGLSPFAISSTVVPALNLESPAVSTTSSGAEDRKAVSPELPAMPTLSGSLSATLSSVVDPVGARSGLDATLADVGVAGGLLSVPSATVALATSAVTSGASGTRSISIPSIEVLDLGAVLEGLGLSLTDLPLDDLFALLDGLGIVLRDLTDPAALVATVDAALDALQGETGALTDELCSTVDDALDPLPVSCDRVSGTVEALVDDLQGVVGDLITGILATLDDTALLSVHGIEVGLVAEARSTVEASVTEVTGTIGSIQVGAVTLPGLSGLDLTAASDVLSAAGDTVSDAVGSVLGLVNAELADMIDVDVLTIDEIVAANGEYATASAAVTALTVSITPPALLTGALAVTDTASDALTELGATVPAPAPVMAELNAALGLDLLTSASTITVGRLTSSSNFRPMSATLPTSSDELPRTGSDAAVPAIAAVLVAGVALGIRRFIAGIAP